MVTIASQVLGDVMSLAIPIAIVFEVGNLIVCPVILHLFSASALNEHVFRNLGRFNFAILFS